MYPETILPIAAHIPHSGTVVPDSVRDQFLPWAGELWREIAMVTDWYTDELFGMPGVAITQTPISRVVVDLERYFDDNLEKNAAFGQGVIYTHNTLGEQIRRELSKQERSLLLDNYYHPFCHQLCINVEQQIARWGHCLLLDCHSFPDEPFAHEDDGDWPRPDICLGTCVNTPQWLRDSCLGLFRQRGYSVGVNFPYSGCLVPDRFLGDPQVPTIMIEVNRRLYLKPASREVYRLGNVPIKLGSFEGLRNDIWSIMLSLAQEAECRGAVQGKATLN